MIDYAVTLKAVGVNYSSKNVLRDINLDVKPGEFVAIVGRSGEGKTTLLNAVAGITPSSGQVVVSGRLGFVFQNNALFPWMTVRQNILFGIADRPSTEQQRILQDLVAKLGISGLESRYPHQISGGQAQRVAVGRALAVDPHVLLMDEPFASLDYFTRTEMEEWLARISLEDKRAVVFVTHDVEEALYLADRVLVLRNGAASDITVELDRPRVPTVRFEPEFIALKKRLLEMMDYL